MASGSKIEISTSDVLSEIDTHRSVPDLLAKQADQVVKIATTLLDAFKKGRRVYICGNGGSAADAQHIAAELIGRYKRERQGLAAIALTTDTSVLTAWSNDYQYETVFSRQVEALGNEGDILWALSTSGNSANCVRAVEAAKSKKMIVFTMTGHKGGKLKPASDLNINIESEITARIQEGHMLCYHIICELIDRALA